MGGCGCGPGTGRVQRLTFPNFGPDIGTRWGKIPRTFAAKFVAIGPESEWDCCLLKDTPVGDVILSAGSPLVVPLDTDIIIKPFRSAGNDDTLTGKLDLLVYDHEPAAYPGQRVPRVYPEKATTLSTTEAAVSLNPAATSNLVTAGCKSFSLYLHNNSAIDMSWRLVGLRDDGGDNFPISPSGYAETAPTFNTLTAGHREAWHLDMSVDAHEHVRLYAKSASGTPSLRTWAEVHG